MKKDTQLKTLELPCYACEDTSTHVMIIPNVVKVDAIGIYPIMRDLSLYACEDCGSVRIKGPVESITEDGER